MSPPSHSILFLDKVFLDPLQQAPRGVEVFNLNLIRDLAGLGFPATVAAHPSWRSALRERTPRGNLEIVCPPPGSAGLLAGATVALRLARRRFAVLLQANVANRLIPALALFRLLRLAPRCVLVAHREPSRRALRAQARWPTTVVAVNGRIADHFRRAGFADVSVRYGITDADRFHPGPARPPGAPVSFCVIGALDSAWKGADTALDAFRRLPPGLRAGCCLHLAAYRSPPAFPDAGVRAYSWLPFERVAEFLRGMDVMLVPSRDEGVMRETFSQAMVQGMLTGLPVIATDLPVLAEKLDQGGGLLVRSPSELADGMARLARDADLRRAMGEQGRRTALARYAWSTPDFAARFLFRDGP